MAKKNITYVYVCTNTKCRNIQKFKGVKKSTLECPVCGKKMRFSEKEIEIGSEKKHEFGTDKDE
jgi:C4-type Zn-finger protein